jgi:hypothetical protein
MSWSYYNAVKSKKRKFPQLTRLRKNLKYIKKKRTHENFIRS